MQTKPHDLKQNGQTLTAVLVQKVLHVSIEENPFEKGFFLKCSANKEVLIILSKGCVE